MTQGNKQLQENPLISTDLFLLFLLPRRSLIWIAAASWVWAVWGGRGGRRWRGGWGRAVIVAVTAAVAVIWRRAGGVAAVWRWVTGRAVWITAAAAGVFSPESKWRSTKERCEHGKQSSVYRDYSVTLYLCAVTSQKRGKKKKDLLQFWTAFNLVDCSSDTATICLIWKWNSMMSTCYKHHQPYFCFTKTENIGANLEHFCKHVIFTYLDVA